ncbi:facilitated trehalose transporter Tret1-like [Teleopsis dalmanni]|uniref:facilitated trehalose transporter Tret1-like n=1 Tax=Teleopsis dalmanni TaxID=139649 RepID=UPI0018CF5E2E|nr:facilitated trehalose transporter Tret1-like [Teleopsis dalmanni]XP_037943862.1 facilitated trehalose transporter Tret1-like [Teleopsis dalmanni]
MEGVNTMRIFIAACAANLAAFAVGTCLGWTSPMASKLLSNNTDELPLEEQVSESDFAWISSIITLGALIAPFIAGPFTNKIGRKWVLMSSSFFFVLAYTLMLLATQVWILQLARLIQGFGVGYVMTALPIYVAEISTDNVRGVTGSLMQLFINMGILFVYAIGPYVSYEILQWCCLVVPLFFNVIFYFMPESPHYYVGKARKTQAIKSLKYLRGQSDKIVENEADMLECEVQKSLASKCTIMDVLGNAGNRKALLICSCLIAFQQLSGINVVLFNSQTIFQSANTGFDPPIASIIVGIVQVTASILAPLAVVRFGRKSLLIFSSIGMTIGLGALGTFFYIQQQGDSEYVAWLPVPSLVLYIVVFCLGFGSLPWTLLGEMFPANIKSMAASIVTSTCWILSFAVIQCYSVIALYGVHYAFWLFAGTSTLGFVFTMFMVIETKGLSLQEIQNRLNS